MATALPALLRPAKLAALALGVATPAALQNVAPATITLKTESGETRPQSRHGTILSRRATRAAALVAVVIRNQIKPPSHTQLWSAPALSFQSSTGATSLPRQTGRLV